MRLWWSHDNNEEHNAVSWLTLVLQCLQGGPDMQSCSVMQCHAVWHGPGTRPVQGKLVQCAAPTLNSYRPSYKSLWKPWTVNSWVKSHQLSSWFKVSNCSNCIKIQELSSQELQPAGDTFMQHCSAVNSKQTVFAKCSADGRVKRLLKDMFNYFLSIFSLCQLKKTCFGQTLSL